MTRYLMTRVISILISCGFCAMPLFAAELPADQQVYVVTMRPEAAVEGTGVIAGQMAATYGGTVMKGGGGDDTFTIRVPRSRARVLAADPRVKSVVPMGRVPMPQTAVVETVGWSSGVSYNYDGVGNITQIGNDTFFYAGVPRPPHATVNSVGRTYNYDAYGNRTACTQLGQNDCQGFSINTAENRNRITGAGYDPSGNLTGLSGHIYSYDSMSMMTRDTFGPLAREFVYTADDERIATYNVGSSWSWAVRGTDGKVLREFTSNDGPAAPGTTSWQWLKDFVWRDGLLLASTQPAGTSTTTYHYHLDHLGTPRRITDQNDRIVGVHDYFAFGPELSGNTAEPSAATLKYTGHERDEWSSGSPDTLDYMHARYYSPWTGRFLSVDRHAASPSRPQSWNRYSYAANNPIAFLDPDGNAELYFHIYANPAQYQYTASRFAARLIYDDKDGVRYRLQGHHPNAYTSGATAHADLVHSLGTKGALVVVFGHTAPHKQGVPPPGLDTNGTGKAAITNSTLTSMLNKSSAAVAVVAGCSSADCIGRVTSGTTVVGISSGKDGVTSTNYGAQALEAFVNVLVGSTIDSDGKVSGIPAGDVGDAIDAANQIFEDAGIDDRFVLLHGSNDTKLQ
jgi:RHS repeat-associated protein